MKKIALMALLFMAASVSSFASSKIVKDSLDSKILSSKVIVNVYLPDGFDKTDKLYPVVYLLHGLYGTYTDWQKQGSMQNVANELIASGEASEMVIIMPNAGGGDVHNINNGYFNVKDWNYEDFFFQELMPVMEKKYRCVGDKGHRAVMGLSMGGGGSTVYCQRHPDCFSSCYAMSAWLDIDISKYTDTDIPKDKFYLTVMSVMEHSPLKFVDNADDKTIEALKSVKWFFDCGDDDSLLYLSVDLHKKYKAKNINSELRVHNGVHNWEYWHLALRDALPFASRNFDK